MHPETEPHAPPVLSIDELLSRGTEATAQDVQHAINGLSPHTQVAAQDAELIYGIALGGLRMNPDDETWHEVEQRAYKVLQRETN